MNRPLLRPFPPRPRRPLGLILALPLALLGPSSAGAQTTQGSAWSADLYGRTTDQNYRDFAPFGQAVNFEAVDYPLLHAAVFFETNRQRRQNNLRPLAWNFELETAAYHHSRLMATEDFFDHTSPVRGRTEPEDRAALAGLANPKIAENIATVFGLNYAPGRSVYFHGPGEFSYNNRRADRIPAHTYASLAEALVTQWMNSPGHRRNILSRDGLALGVGLYLTRDGGFNQMPTFTATQKFQWFEAPRRGPAQDPPPPGWQRP